MKRSQGIALCLCMAASAAIHLDSKAQSGSPAGNGGISMTIYPITHAADGIQYLITPSGKQVAVPGLVIAPNATQLSVYRDQANHFWYTDVNGKQVAVTPGQIEAAQAQINSQSGGGGMPPQTMPPAQSYYSSTPSYAGGYNGIPYGTPVNMEAPGQYSYMAPGGNKQFVTPTAQTSPQLNQWQQQVPYGQQQNVGAMQAAQPMQAAPQAQTSKQASGAAQSQGGDSRMDKRRDRRAERLDDRAKDQSQDASNNQAAVNSKEQSGQTLGTGFEARRAAREERRAKREERRADNLSGN